MRSRRRKPPTSYSQLQLAIFAVNAELRASCSVLKKWRVLLI